MSRTIPTSATAVALAVAVALLPTACGEDARYRRARSRMVSRQLRARKIRDNAVLRSMSTVPRHLFVPKRLLGSAYDDHPLPIGHGQTISQPYIVALMTQLLDLEPTDKVLEVGTGSGYQAAVLSGIVKEVYSMEIIRDLGAAAKKRLADLKYENVTVEVGDGYHGWPEQAPFDAIIVTAAATDIPPPLIEQLKPQGRMAIPVGPQGQVQWLKLVTKNEEGPPTVKNVTRVRFVPLTGNH